MSTTARPALGVAMVTVAATVWGFNGTVSKLLIESGFDPPQLTTFRATGAFVGILAIVLVLRGPRALRTSRAELPRLLVYGVIGLYAVPMLYFVAISRLPVGIGLLFEFTAPAFVALWVRFGEHQQVRRRLWLGLAMCVAGLAGVAQVWTAFGQGLRLDGLGVVAGLASAMMLAAYYVLGAKFVAGTTAVGSAEATATLRRDPLTLTCWAFGIAAVAGAVLRPWWNFDTGLLSGRVADQPTWLLLAYLVIFGTIVPYLLLTFSMRHLPPTSVGIIGMVEILLASAFAWVLLGEALDPAQIIGGLILIVGVALAESARVSAGRTVSPTAGTADATRTVAAPAVDDPRDTPESAPAAR